MLLNVGAEFLRSLRPEHSRSAFIFWILTKVGLIIGVQFQHKSHILFTQKVKFESYGLTNFILLANFCYTDLIDTDLRGSYTKNLEI